jgi:hypothetical protein
MASTGRNARIVGADIVVVAIRRRTADAPAVRARVVRRTSVAIVAWAGIVDEHAAAGRHAEIVRAAVTIVADDCRSTNAPTARTGVICGASVAVIAGTAIVHVIAAGAGIAQIIGADIAVIATRRRSANAYPQRARVIRRAGIAVVAGIDIVHVHAAAGWITGVVSTHVAVVAVERRPAHARATGARIVRRAGIAVVTGKAVVDIDADSAKT